MKVAAWVAAALAVVVLLFLLFDGRTESGSSLTDSSDPVAQDTGLDAPARRPDVERATTTQEQVSAPVPSATTETKTPATEEPNLATMKGRFLLPDGNPAVGVKVKLWGSESNDEVVRKHGLPKNWKSQKALTDTEGRFEFFFDPPQAYQLFVDAKLPGYAEVNWRWGQLPRGETTDLGTITLTAGGRIIGRLTDKDGRPVFGDWSVYADCSLQTRGSGGDRTRATSSVNPETGSFTLEDLPPGPTELQAESRQTGWVYGPTVEVRAGQTIEARIVYEGPDTSRRITLVTFCDLFHIFSDDVDAVTLHGAASGPISAVPHGTQSFSFDNLDPASEYRVEIASKNFVPYTQEGLKPGNSYNAFLVGCSAVALQVLDSESGEAVSDYRLTIRYRNLSVWPNEFEIRGRKKRGPKDGVYRGIVPGDISIIVQTEDSRFGVVDIDGLASNETRNTTVRLSTGAKIQGRVVSQDSGGNIAGASVSLWPTIDPSTPGEPLELLQMRRDLREQEELCKKSKSDAQGSFVFSGLRAGFYEVTARQGEDLWASSDVKVDDVGEVSLVLELPRPGYLAGKLTGLSQSVITSLELILEPVVEGDDIEKWIANISRGEREAARPRLDRDGRFRIGPLVPGLYELSLHVPSERVPWGFSSMIGLSGMKARLTKVLIPAGEDTKFAAELSGRNPGFVRIRSVRNGQDNEPVANVTVVVESIESEEESVDAATEGPEISGEIGGQTDAQGQLVLGPVFPGQWQLRANTIDQSWTLSPRRIQIPPGGEISVDLEVQVVHGELEILNKKDGTPVANYELTLEYPDGSSRGIGTDHRGRLQLSLGPGEYVFWGGDEAYDEEAPPEKNPNRHVVQWTATGPVPPVLKVDPGKQ